MKTFVILQILLSISMDVNSQFFKYRQVLIFGGQSQTELIQKQVQALDKEKAGIMDRDIRVTVVDAEETYKKYKVKPGAFTVILIGKDGGEKHRTPQIIQPRELFAIIDVMPMRRSEMRKNK